MSNTTTRNDVKQLAEQIEVLARSVQTELQSNGDFLTTANKLVGTNLTLVFALGEIYALEKVSSSSIGAVKATAVKNPNGTSVNWHNVRDQRGRFAKKV